MSDAAILIGACGWQFPQWQDSYYPEGLPEDWQLAYYGNEYPVVLLPSAFWLQDATALANWREELAERPAFIAEWRFSDDAKAQAAMRGGLDSIADRVIGVLVTLESMPDAAQLRTIRELAAGKQVVLDGSVIVEHYHELQAQLEPETRVGYCWRGDVEQVELLDAGPLIVARIVSTGQTPRSLRSLIEIVMTRAGDRQAIILFDGDPPDLEVVDQAEVILNLL